LDQTGPPAQQKHEQASALVDELVPSLNRGLVSKDSSVR
jgi:hypothetical protein